MDALPISGLNLALLIILAIYFLRGLFRNAGKSVLSFILFPLGVTAYVLLPLWLGKHALVPVHMLGLIKLLIISFVGVTLIKWLLYFLLSALLQDPYKGRSALVKIPARLPSACVSFGEGAMVLVLCFWILDYGDSMLERRFPGFYQELQQNLVFQKVTDHNLLFDIPGAKSFKVVFSVAAHPTFADRLAERSEYQEIMDLPSVRTLQLSDEFRVWTAQNRIFKILTHAPLYAVLKDEILFAKVTSERFLKACREILPAYHQQLIDEKEGQLSGLKPKGSVKTPKEPVREAFQPGVNVRLKNGFSFMGNIIHENFGEITLQMAEGNIVIQKSEIQSVTPISAPGASSS